MNEQSVGEGFDQAIRETGEVPSPLKRDDGCNSHYICIILREIHNHEGDILKVTESLKYDSKSILREFYKKMLDFEHSVRNRTLINLLLGALKAQEVSPKQLWVAIIYGLTGCIKSFVDSESLDYAQRFSKTRKCPLLQRDEEGTRTVFYAPEFVVGDQVLWQLFSSLFYYDEYKVIEGKIFEFNENPIWYTIADEFQKICNSKSISYEEGGKVTIHNALVSMALAKYKMAKKPVFQAPVKTLASQFRAEISKDEQSLLECINYHLRNLNIEVGKKSLIDASYIIRRNMPSVMYTTIDKDSKQKKVVTRSYSPYGWHKISSNFKSNRTTIVLKDYASITVAARDCAVSWTKELSNLTKVRIDSDNIDKFSDNIRAYVSLSQKIKKDWISSQNTDKIKSKLKLVEELTYNFHLLVCSSTTELQEAIKDDFSLIEAWLITVKDQNVKNSDSEADN